MELEVQPGAVRARSLVIPCPATGRPGTSCSTRVRPPWLTATTPQSGHPISAHGVATVTVNRSGVRATPCMCTPSSPSRTSHRAHGSVAGALAHPVALVTVEVLEWNGSLVASDPRGPRPPHLLIRSYRRAAPTPTRSPKSQTTFVLADAGGIVNCVSGPGPDPDGGTSSSACGSRFPGEMLRSQVELRRVGPGRAREGVSA